MGKTPKEWARVCETISAGFVGSTGKRHTYANGQAFVRGAIAPLGLWKRGDRVLEIGSGNGRIAMGLIGEGLDYHGVEIISESVAFCKDAFHGEGEFRFYHLDVQNGRYNAKGAIDPEIMRLPFGDGEFDTVLALSLFSHLGTLAAAQQYISETARVIKAGGKFLSTWYLRPPGARVSESEARTVYSREDAIRELEHFFEIVSVGGGQLWGDQEFIVGVRR